ncbi:MAG: hypothetical protein M3P29_11310 [Acidobacteriota bacterium]|nr:hypothetical protein [Acidobacteriota bacterium]
MAKLIRHRWILAVVAVTLTACGKLTPSTASTIIQHSDPRTYYLHLRIGQHPIDDREKKFHEAGLTEFQTHPNASGKEETDIVLTKLGEQELHRVRAKSCGPGCWSVPLGERSGVIVKDLIGGQDATERAVFTWEVRPNSVGRAFDLPKIVHEGTADFKKVSGHWILSEMNDGAPAP